MSLADPTLRPPPGYTLRRALEVYQPAFRRVFEYLAGARVSGHVLEFGTLQGFSARVFASFMAEFGREGQLALYDSFEGLPAIEGPDRTSYEVAVNAVWFEGQMKLEGGIAGAIERALSPLLRPGQLELHPGFFEATLPDALPAGPAAVVHLDCDLYSSSVTVLRALMERGCLQDGCVLLADDYNCNRANPTMGERRALQEVFAPDGRFSVEPWFGYGWHAQAFFVHDREAATSDSVPR